ncbi:MAG: bifunctional riboflavin kinase/FAD synthetase [Candidatus Magnetomorum sp.]|nr:bifunctional riboflavin kinase/FAD synthetase [Candidatus Magnetomorum sp.]
MKRINGIENIATPFSRAVLTIGNFDGVHLGHQRLFARVVETAKKINGTSAAMTFEPHPMKVLQPDGCPFPLITLFEQKMELMEKTGLDILIVIPFNHEFAQISAQSFVQDLLVNRIGIKAMIIGNDYCFGKKREGNVQLLQQYGRELGFDVQVVPWKPVGNKLESRISSTAIRSAVSSGDLDQARAMLGRYYQVRGIVRRGRNRGGRLLGFPTANLQLCDELKPLSGVYAVSVLLQNKSYLGVANIGFSPTFDDQQYTLEVHLLDFLENIYDKNICVNFIKRLRGEKKFSSIEALSDQIHRDIHDAQIIFASLRLSE